MKKKLRLQVETLQVEQFQVEDALADNGGTVNGHWNSTALCTQYCGASNNANTAPCLLCPEMPLTYSCDPTRCC